MKRVKLPVTYRVSCRVQTAEEEIVFRRAIERLIRDLVHWELEQRTSHVRHGLERKEILAGTAVQLR